MGEIVRGHKIRNEYQVLLSLVFLVLLSANNWTYSSAAELQNYAKLNGNEVATEQQKGCQIYHGETVAIMEIEESRGSDFSQRTSPLELPIGGSVENGQIELRIESETHKFFQLSGKQLHLTRPLNRDPVLKDDSSLQIQHPAISSVYIQISCSQRQNDAQNQSSLGSKIIVPVLVKVIDINDNAPRFSSPEFNVQFNELTPVGTVILGPDQLRAVDLDSANNGQIEYSLVRYPPISSAINNKTTSPRPSSPSQLSNLTSSHNSSFNISSEPIINGPASEEEIGDDESEESLLASLASPPSSNLTHPHSQPQPHPHDTDDLNNRPISERMRKKRNLLNQDTTHLPWTNLLESKNNTNLLLDIADQGFDSTEFFALEISNQGPLIKLKRELDFETRQVHRLKILATDKANNRSERRSSSALITVRVSDGDDQPPGFILEQGGCATGSMSTATSPIPSNYDRAGNERDNAHGQKTHHSGFKVTDQNDDFDFGDSEPRQNRDAKLTSYSCLTPGPVLKSNDGNGKIAVAEYWANINVGESDQIIRISPQPIKARDRDQLNAQIHYKFINGTPSNYSHYFQIDHLEGSVKQVAPVDQLSSISKRFVIWLEAQEQSVKKLSSVARLTIDVKQLDWSIAPVLNANSPVGFVEENSPIGSRVMIWSTTVGGSKIRVPMKIESQQQSNLSEFDNPHSELEFESTSDAFQVDKNGYVLVSRSNLDADSREPGIESCKSSVYSFQVTARYVPRSYSQNNQRLMSSPLSLNVTLIDIDDNGPELVLANGDKPKEIEALSQEGVSRLINTISATDRDCSLENKQFRFSILHVSNGGRDRFRLNESSGELWALGKFITGELFSLTIQVTDIHGTRPSQSIMEFKVIPGPNLGGPQFLQVNPASSNSAIAPESSELDAEPSARSAVATRSGEHINQQLAVGDFQVEISESLPPRSPVFQLRAYDPENDPITYSIIAGNINQDFGINPATGAIFVRNKLDREEVSLYQLVVQARDSGGLTTSRILRVKLLDTNDENPIFSQDKYEFSISEASTYNTFVGQIRASDSDTGDFGRLSYHLEAISHSNGINDGDDKIFSLNEQTGEIKLTGKLDYEKVKSYLLIARAQDQEKRPRSANCRIIIKVLDAPDEKPYFDLAYIQLELWENKQVGEQILQIEAIDIDTIQQDITYEIKWTSSPGLFKIDSKTGSISLDRAFDYEQAKNHSILIGTVEWPVATDQLDHWLTLAKERRKKSPVCLIDFNILDLNDHAPVFNSSSLMPIRIKDLILPGTKICQLHANDADGSRPNNEIIYYLNKSPGTNSVEVSGNCANDCFAIDRTSGSISVRCDLKRHSVSECQLDVVAQDLGQVPNSLSANASIMVFIDHEAELEPRSGIVSFADNHFFADIYENSNPTSLVRVLPIVGGKLRGPIVLGCEIISGDDLPWPKFESTINQNHDCELRLRANQSLDFEQRQRYDLTARLNTITSSQQVSGKLIAHITINVLDKNDNRPVFKIPARYSHLTQGRYLGVVSSDAPVETQILQVRAHDADSGQANGLIQYDMTYIPKNVSEPYYTDIRSRFKIDPNDGQLRTALPLDDIPKSYLPLKFRVLARDQPDSGEEPKESQAELVLNLLDPVHRLALVLRDVAPSQVIEIRDDLLTLIQERSGLIAGLDRLESLKLLRSQNSTITYNSDLDFDVNGTDFWFYLVEPVSLRLVRTDDVRVTKTLLEDQVQNSLRDILRLKFAVNWAHIRPPYSVKHSMTNHENLISSSDWYSSITEAAQNSNGADIASRIFLTLSAHYSRASPVNYSTIIIIGAVFMALISFLALVFHWGSRSALTRQRNKTRRQLSINQEYLKKNQLVPIREIPSNGKTSNENGSNTYESFSGVQLYSGSNNEQMTRKGDDYETQMLKMSVMYDDTHSIERGYNQNLQQNRRR